MPTYGEGKKECLKLSSRRARAWKGSSHGSSDSSHSGQGRESSWPVSAIASSVGFTVGARPIMGTFIDIC